MIDHVARVPSWHDMDLGYTGEFLRHWVKRHSYPEVFDQTHNQFPNDDVPLWYAIRRLHDRIHEGESEFPVPTDHIHLLPLAEQIKADLEDVL